jgi:hypothetical protein
MVGKKFYWYRQEKQKLTPVQPVVYFRTPKLPSAMLRISVGASVSKETKNGQNALAAAKSNIR